MAESRSDRRQLLPAETTGLRLSDRSGDVDHHFRSLAYRRRRFCLYHLMLANEPLPIRDLAEAVEASLSPPGAMVTERIIDDSAFKLVHTHLPTLRDAGLVQLDDGSVSLAPDPALPIRELLSTTAAVELDLPETG